VLRKLRLRRRIGLRVTCPCTSKMIQNIRIEANSLRRHSECSLVCGLKLDSASVKHARGLDCAVSIRWTCHQDNLEMENSSS
jgi:hypothetical protein